PSVTSAGVRPPSLRSTGISARRSSTRKRSITPWTAFARSASSMTRRSRVGRLGARGYVEHECVARCWVERRERFKPRGDRALRTELAQKGVGRDVVDIVLGERAPDADVEQARRALSRPLTRWEGMPDAERKRKIHAYLAARGFDYDTIDE